MVSRVGAWVSGVVWGRGEGKYHLVGRWRLE